MNKTYYWIIRAGQGYYVVKGSWLVGATERCVGPFWTEREAETLLDKWI